MGESLFSAAASISESLEKALEYIRGGTLTDTLESMGDIHLISAGEHIRQAGRSNSPEQRMFQANAELQTAYVLSVKAAGAGPSRRLRIIFDMDNMTRSRMKALDCASTIALLQWATNESTENRRQWLDRASRQLVLHIRTQVDKAFGWRNEVPSSALPDPLWYYMIFTKYRELEGNTLPRNLTRAKKLTVSDLGLAGFDLEMHRRVRGMSSDPVLFDDMQLAQYFFREEAKREWNDPLERTI